MAETEEIVAAALAPVLEAPKDPYDKPVLESIRKFFQKRAKSSIGSYDYTPGGNLKIKNPAGTIQLKRFLPLEPSERAALEEYRLEALAELQEQYEAERITLSEAWATYKSTGAIRGVLAANQRVAELDVRISAARSAVRNIVPIDNPRTKDILLSERYEERKIYDQSKDPWDKEIMRLFFYDFKPEHDQGKYVIDQEVDATAAAVAEEAAGGEPSELTFRQTLKDGRKARIFFETNSDVNGFLSPRWPVTFTMGDTQYSSAVQAYEVERAKELGLEELRKSLLKTRAPRTIALMMRKVAAHPVNAKGLWLKIFTEIYQQTETLKARLLATGTDALVYADVREGPSGIGLAEKDSGVFDPAKWKGENAVGVALETVRTQLREGNLSDAPVNSAPKEAVITEDEQEKAKVGAIINSRRNSFR